MEKSASELAILRSLSSSMVILSDFSEWNSDGRRKRRGF